MKDKIIIISTPKGTNHFMSLFEECLKMKTREKKLKRILDKR